MKRKIVSFFLTLALSATGFTGVTMADLPTAAAATNPNCASNGPDPALGTDFVTYTIPTAGTYTIWTRMQTDTSTNNSYYLQIDCGAPITVGGTSLTANTWTFVNWRDGNTSSKITATLTAGSHTFNLTGKDPNVIVDRVIFATDPACVPTSTGDNCAVPATSPTPTPTGTPVALPGDVNLDSRVNLVDLSLLLSHWATNNYPAADFNHDGTVNLVDLSQLLSHWTG